MLRKRSKLFNIPGININGDAIFHILMWGMALILLCLVLLLFYELLLGAAPALQAFGFGFLANSDWNPVKDIYGALPSIYGTAVSSLFALALAGPMGVLAAIYLAEYAPAWLESVLSFVIELLASIPSVVYGLWGIFVLVPPLRELEIFLKARAGSLPIFDCTPYGFGMFAGALILAIMIVPYTTAVARDVLRAVPNEQREAMLALGATRWEAIRMAVIPYAASGIIGGVMLALGRAVGETMAVTMLIGNRAQVSACLFAPAYTLASQIANEFTEATSDIQVSALIELGLVLFGMTLLLNFLGHLLVVRTRVRSDR